MTYPKETCFYIYIYIFTFDSSLWNPWNIKWLLNIGTKPINIVSIHTRIWKVHIWFMDWLELTILLIWSCICLLQENHLEMLFWHQVDAILSPIRYQRQTTLWLNSIWLWGQKFMYNQHRVFVKTSLLLI
jgi:hypothetical protein